MEWMPCLVRSETPKGGELRVGVGDEVVDDYLEFLAARCRPNTVLAAVFDLKVFFTLVPKDPTEMTTADVLAFITAQPATLDPTVVRLSDGESGLSARTIQRRLSSVSGMFSFLVAQGDVAANAAPKGLSTRRSREGAAPACSWCAPREPCRGPSIR